MSNAQFVDPAIIQQFLLEKLNTTSVSEKLSTLGYDKELIAKYLSEFQRAKTANRRTLGIICVAVGGVLGFVSCVLTIINPIPELYYWFLFGLTTFAVTLACYGFYNIFE